MVNALIHRDYLIRGGRIMVEVYVDRVEISNPGSLPNGLSKADFGTRSLTRNPNLADILLRTPYMERLGTGIQRIKLEVEKAGLAAPSFSFDGHFSVVISRLYKKDHDSINDPINVAKTSNLYADSQLLEILSGSGITVLDPINDPIKRYLKTIQLLAETPLKRADLAASLDVSEATIKRDMKVLRDAGIVQYEGSNKTGMYYLNIKL